MKRYICLDAGGTEIKAAAALTDGTLEAPVRSFPSRSGEAAEAILSHFAGIIEKICGDREADGMRFSFPGPFDYPKGVCLIRGLGKYDSLYGLELRSLLKQRLCPEKGAEDIRFVNDATAFGLGEAAFGSAGTKGKALCVPVGTGCGSVFLVDGAPAENGFPGVPENGYIYPAPFLDGCIDDHISKRGLMGLSRQILGRPLEGRELAEAAFRGDPGARRVWNIFGERLRDALSGYLMPGGFAPSVLCLGGGVMKSAPLFIGPLERLCDSLGIRLTVETDTPQMILKGLTRI